MLDALFNPRFSLVDTQLLRLLIFLVLAQTAMLAVLLFRKHGR